VPNNVLSEIGRVCRDGARIEIWTPYAFSSEAFLYGHEAFLSDLPWLHFCVSHRDAHAAMLRGVWQLERVVYVVDPAVRAEIEALGMPLAAAIRYWQGVVREFGVEIRYRTDAAAPVVHPEYLWSDQRHGGVRHRLADATPAPAPSPTEVASAPVWTSVGPTLRAVGRRVSPWRGSFGPAPGRPRRPGRRW
jgi:hypothetical protein